MRENRILAMGLLLAVTVAFTACGGGGSDGDGGGPNPTTSVTFPFDNFTGVSVVGPFSVTVIPGPYSIRVTVDSGLHRQLDVREGGQVLEIGFVAGSNIQSETMTVEIAMPTLESMSFVGATVGTISDFSGSVLEVQLTDVAMLEGQNVSFDLLMASAKDVSVLLLEDVNPLPAADVNISDNSSVTVNMMDHGVLTGAATTTSTLGYYGSNVSISVATDQTSSVVRLGDSRP